MLFPSQSGGWLYVVASCWRLILFGGAPLNHLVHSYFKGRFQFTSLSSAPTRYAVAHCVLDPSIIIGRPIMTLIGVPLVGTPCPLMVKFGIAAALLACMTFVLPLSQVLQPLKSCRRSNL